MIKSYHEFINTLINYKLFLSIIAAGYISKIIFEIVFGLYSKLDHEHDFSGSSE